MKRSPVKLLILPLAAVLLTLTLRRCPPGPGEPTPPPHDPHQTDQPGVPETFVLRVVAKRQVARQVSAGRLSLPQAAALFGALNALPPQAADLSKLDPHLRPPQVAPRTDEERLCWQVIRYVAAELEQQPDRARAVVARLEAELEEELRTRGRIRLPNPPSPAQLQTRLEQAREEIDRLLDPAPGSE